MAKLGLKRIGLALDLVLAPAGAVLWAVGSRRAQQANVRTQEDVYVPLRFGAVRWQFEMRRCPPVRELQDAKCIDPAYSTDPWGGPYLIE